MISSGTPVDTKQVLALRRSLFPRRPVVSYAGTVYVAVFALGMMVALTWGFWRHLADLATDVGFTFRIALAPAGVLLFSLVILRYSIWQGFVSFSEPDCAHLLTAPLERAGLVWPRLRSACCVAGVAGALLGAVAVLVSSGPPGGPARAALGGVAGLALGVSLVGVGWQVQRLPRVSLWLMRLTAPVLMVAVLLVFAERAGGIWRIIALWSGPWGWVVLPLAGGSWETRVVGLGLVCASAVAGLIGLKWTAGTCSLESFRRRARARSRAVAGAYSFDVRAVVLAARDTSVATRRASAARGTSAIPRQTRVHPPVPCHPKLAVPRHGFLTLLRSPYRLGWSALLGGGGVVLLTIFPERLSALLGGALTLYLAAGTLLEPLRLEVDSPFVSQVLLPFTFGEVLWLHCLLPGVILIGEGVVIIAVLWVTGAAAGMAVGPTLALLVPTVGFTIVAAALSARRGGRLPMNILLATAGDVTGFSVVSIIGWIFGWALLAVTGVTMAWRVPAAAGGTVMSVLSVAVVLLTAAAVLRRLLLRSQR